MKNSALQVPVDLDVYRYRSAHEVFVDQSPYGEGTSRCHCTAIYVKHRVSYMKQTVVSGSLAHDSSLICEITQLQYASCMKHTVVSWPFSNDHACIQQRKLWYLCTVRFLLRRRCRCKHKFALARALTILLLLAGDIELNPGPSKQWLKSQAKKQRYLLQREEVLARKRLQYAEDPQHKKEVSKADYAATQQRKRAVAKANYAAHPEPKRAALREQYATNPERKRAVSREVYAANPERKRAALREQYAANPEQKRAAAKAQYANNPKPKRDATKALYAANPQPKRAAAKALYAANPATKRANLRIRYQANPHVFRESVKAYYEQQKTAVNLYRRGKYDLREPKALVKAQIAKALGRKLFTLPRLRLSLRLGFKHAYENVKCMPKAMLNKTASSEVIQ